jgi:excisionase family DNA binding protein
MDNQTYTVPELAERWKVHTVTVYRMLERRELPGFKIGKAWRIAAATVAAFEQTLPNQFI